MIKLFSRSRFFLVAVLALLLLPPDVLAEAKVAADAATATDWSKLADGAGKLLAGVASVVITIMLYFSYFFALMLGKLMNSTYVFDTGLGDTLQKIWVVMRNFVNLGFILVLLVLAVQVILGIGSEGGIGTLKKVLPKLVLALVAVNLTFFAARAVLTTNDVLAASIFTMPRIVAGDNLVRAPGVCTEADLQQWDRCVDKIAKTLALHNVAAPGSGQVTSAKAAEDAKAKLADIMRALRKGHEKGVEIQKWVGADNIGVALLLNLVDLNTLLSVQQSAGQGFNLVSNLGGMIVAIVTAALFFMLFLAFLIRLAVIWLFIALAPLGVLAIALGEVFPSLATGGDMVEKFIKHAFMPTMVAMPLSIGMIMLFGHGGVTFDPTQFKLIFAPGYIDGDILIEATWWLLGIVVLWKGVDWAISASSEYAHAVTSTVKEKVEGVASSVAGAASYAPILPKIGGLSPGSFFQTLHEAPAQFVRGQEEKERGAKNAFMKDVLHIDVPQVGKQEVDDHVTKAGSKEEVQSAFVSLAKNGSGNHAISAEALKNVRKLYGDKVNGGTYAEVAKSLKDLGHTEFGPIATAIEQLKAGESGGEKVKPDTGVASARAGEVVAAGNVIGTPTAHNGAGTTQVKFENKPVYEVEVKNADGTSGGKHLATQETDGSYKLLMNNDDLRAAVDDVADGGSNSERHGEAIARRLREMKKSKDILTQPQKDEIKRKVIGAYTDHKIDADLEDNVQREYDEIFGAGSFASDKS